MTIVPLHGTLTATFGERSCPWLPPLHKKPEIYPGSDRTSVILTIPHKPGSLSRLLSRIEAMHINLTKLESRPIPGQDFEFLFYFDLESPIESPALLRLLGELESTSEKFRYLGTYREVL